MKIGVCILHIVVRTNGLRAYFIATRSLFPAEDVNFIVQLNDRHRVVFDTGSIDSWIKSSALADGGYESTGQKRIPKVSEFYYPFSGLVRSDHAVDEQFAFDIFSKIQWNQIMPIISSGGQWMTRADGILGASLSSPVTRTVKVFTTVPFPDHFRLYAGHVGLSTGNCFPAPLTDLGLKLNKWIISGSIMIGDSSYTFSEFEVDTGFTPLALHSDTWEVFKNNLASKGALYVPTESSGHSHVFDNCFVDIIPTVTYRLGSGWTMTIESASFVSFESNGMCVVHVVPHDSRVSYIGVPVLSSALVEFNSETKSVTFCQDKNVSYL